MFCWLPVDAAQQLVGRFFKLGSWIHIIDHFFDDGRATPSSPHGCPAAAAGISGQDIDVESASHTAQAQIDPAHEVPARERALPGYSRIGCPGEAAGS
jgi:hypothetical protein